MVLVNPLQKEQKFPSKVLRKKTNGLSNNIENNKKNENRIPEVFYKKSEFFWQNSQENTFDGVSFERKFSWEFCKMLKNTILTERIQRF